MTALARKPKRDAVDRAERIGPTPETAAKLRPDVVAALWAVGRIDGLHRQAAEEIRDIWAAMERGIFGRSLDDRINAVATAARNRAHLDHMTEAERLLYGERYLPWAREMAGPRLVIAIATVIDNWPSRTVAIEARMTVRQVHRALRRGLQRYAEIAGWT